MSNVSAFDEYVGEFTNEGAAAAAAAAEYNPGGVNRGKIEAGSNLLRILPPKPGRQNPFAPRFTHFLKGGAKVKVVACLAAHSGLPCAACDEMARLLQGDELSRKDADELRCQSTHEVAAINMNAPIPVDNPSMAVRTYELKRAIVLKLTAIRNNARSGGNYAHPLTGFPVEVTKSGSGMQTSYEVMPVINEKGPIHPDPEVMLAILKSYPDVYAHRLPSVEEVSSTVQEWLDEVSAKAAASRGGRSATALAASMGR